MKQRAIRSLGTPVSAIGLGGMPMSIEGRPDRDRSVATIHAALDAGITLIDTADAYHLHADDVGHNETLIAEALASDRVPPTRWARAAAMNSSRSPSSTAAGLPFSTLVRRSFTIW